MKELLAPDGDAGDLSGLIRLLILVVGLLAGAVLIGSRCRRVEVRGTSMQPALEPGDRLLLVPTRRLRTGDMVGVHDPRDAGRLLVKRVAGVDRQAGQVTVLGDNPPASTDSRTFGRVPLHSVAGRAVYRYAPAWRIGRLP